jgi:hypothetical protein
VDTLRLRFRCWKRALGRGEGDNGRMNGEPGLDAALIAPSRFLQRLSDLTPEVPPPLRLLLEDNRIIARVRKYVNLWTGLSVGDEALPRSAMRIAWLNDSSNRMPSQVNLSSWCKASATRDESSILVYVPVLSREAERLHPPGLPRDQSPWGPSRLPPPVQPWALLFPPQESRPLSSGILPVRPWSQWGPPEEPSMWAPESTAW